ncbi:Transcription initiation factor TFIID component TAF4 family protein [Spraguea lophii 42_110]|uniref:Transcription initiation factor TFIID subunit 4 n=1 Tax=Spraguea lophii (strain 42_110) TaxID=1358809 RepID=S7XJQ2_SPRLO|nr:Transcription initiation factor TFIID component TAF4 family protein [Spraguea lophii 42_110]
MNKEVFDSLDNDQRHIVESLYHGVCRGELTQNDFFEECRTILGPSLFIALFPSMQSDNQQDDKEIKTDLLHDIIEYSGVDLKEEAEKIVRDTEYNIRENKDFDDDIQVRMNNLLNIDRFVQLIKHICRERGFNVSSDTYMYFFLALARKLRDIIEKIDQASELRVDTGRLNHQMNISNDIRRQLWCLEEIEKNNLEKYTIEKGEDQDGIKKKKIKKMIQEREDIQIKKKLSNTVALAALGTQRKSWMSSDSSFANKELETPFQSLYAPVNEKDIERKITNRRLTLDDFIYVLEKDNRYSRSMFTIQQKYK